MLSVEELMALLLDLESDRVERTTAIDKTDKFAEAICAFSNDLPNHNQSGYLLIGADDKGMPSGLKATDELLKNLSGIRSDGNIQPLPVIHVYKITLPYGQGDIAVVETQPSDMPPVRYKGRVYIRVGPRKAIASEQEERILIERRTSSNRSFDARYCPGSSLEDINQNVFLITYLPNAVSKEIIEENNRSIEQKLASLRFFDLKKEVPTHAGIILFGRDPLAWLPGASIQFLRIQGTQLSDDVILEKEFTGDLVSMLQVLDGFMEIQIRTRPEKESALKDKMTSDYPIVAIRELLMNAILHRNYEGSNSPIRFYWFEDRIEIQNPGGLFGEATPENFPNQNSYRNPVLAEALKVLGYVNKYGRGIIRAQDELRKNGNPGAEFKKNDPNYFQAVLRRRP